MPVWQPAEPGYCFYDGSSTRVLPYAERRSLLEELALDGPWRTPASVVVERNEEFVVWAEELGLEGVVA